MNEAVSMIENLLKQHREIKGGIKACQATIGDVEQAEKLSGARESLVPGRLEDHRKKAAQLERELMSVDESLKTHFECEEESLLAAFEKQKLPELALALSKLIGEHEQIGKQIAELKKLAAEVAAGNLSVNVWHEKAWRLKKSIYNLETSIKEHSEKEEVLFKEAKKLIKSGA